MFFMILFVLHDIFDDVFKDDSLEPTTIDFKL